MGDSVTIDGSRGEGGGQILRTALTLSAITGRPHMIARLRAELVQFGFLPVGQGEITARISGLGSQASAHLKAEHGKP